MHLCASRIIDAMPVFRARAHPIKPCPGLPFQVGPDTIYCIKQQVRQTLGVTVWIALCEYTRKCNIDTAEGHLEVCSTEKTGKFASLLKIHPAIYRQATLFVLAVLLGETDKCDVL